jgi:hypothetical protein
MTTITTQDLIDLLPVVQDRGWEILPNGYIRDRDGRCPICSLVHELSGGEIDYTFNTFSAMERYLGTVDEKTDVSIQRIMNAADGVWGAVREDMVEALGLV